MERKFRLSENIGTLHDTNFPIMRFGSLLDLSRQVNFVRSKDNTSVFMGKLELDRKYNSTSTATEETIISIVCPKSFLIFKISTLKDLFLILR